MTIISKKIIFIAALSSLTLIGTTALPAEAVAAVAPEEVKLAQEYQTLKTQHIAAAETLVVDSPTAVLSAEYIKQVEEKAKKEAAEKAAAEAAARAAATPAPTPPTPTTTNNIPVGVGAEGLVAAARAQIGTAQDCTDLVQNALAAVGLFERRDKGGYDLGPMDFGRFGQAIPASEIKAGDIIMRPGHVAVYTGDGVNHSAVHGGWGGFSTVESPYEADPYAYSVIVRIP